MRRGYLSGLRGFCVIIALATGCAEPSPDLPRSGGCETDDALVLTLGAGETDYQDLALGQTPPLEFGPQGGQHVWLALRVENPSPNPTSLDVVLLADEMLCEGCDWRQVGGWQRTLPDPRSMSDDRPPVWVGLQLILSQWNAGLERRFTVEAADHCGRLGGLVHPVDAWSDTGL